MKKVAVFSLVYLVSLIVNCIDTNPVSINEIHNGKIKRIVQYDPDDELEFYLVYEY